MARAKHGKERFGRIPDKVYWSADFMSLTVAQRAVLMALIMQYNGRNNGDLALAETVMKKHGLVGRTALRAKPVLLERNLVALTRPGGQGCDYKCDLFALTWLKIDPCGGKLDAQPTTAPPRTTWNRDAVTMAGGELLPLDEYRAREHEKHKPKGKNSGRKKKSAGNLVSVPPGLRVTVMDTPPDLESPGKGNHADLESPRCTPCRLLRVTPLYIYQGEDEIPDLALLPADLVDGVQREAAR